MSERVNKDIDTNVYIKITKDDVIEFLENKLDTSDEYILDEVDNSIEDETEFEINKEIHIDDHEFYVDEDDVSELINKAIEEREKDLIGDNFKNIELKSAYDEVKLESLMKAYKKYTLEELEEKLK